VAALDLTECGGLLQEIKIAEVSFLKWQCREIWLGNWAEHRAQ
jgi:hypothetical protein